MAATSFGKWEPVKDSKTHTTKCRQRGTRIIAVFTKDKIGDNGTKREREWGRCTTYKSYEKQLKLKPRKQILSRVAEKSVDIEVCVYIKSPENPPQLRMHFFVGFLWFFMPAVRTKDARSETCNFVECISKKKYPK